MRILTKLALATFVSSFGLIFANNFVQAATIQFDTSSVFNADVVVNSPEEVIDNTGKTNVDAFTSGGNTAFITDSAAQLLSVNGNGLPDNGFFAENEFHPEVQLSFSDELSQNNAYTTSNPNPFTFSVLPDMYNRVDIYAISAEGTSDFQVTFNYSDATSSISSLRTVPEWFDDITPTTNRYYLINDMDRYSFNTNDLDNTNDVAVFGFRFFPNYTKTLNSIEIMPTDVSRFTFLGATGTAIPEPATMLGSLVLAGVGLGSRMIGLRPESKRQRRKVE